MEKQEACSCCDGNERDARASGGGVDRSASGQSIRLSLPCIP